MDPQIRLIILDVDGTLVHTLSGEGERTAFAGRSAEADWDWIPGVREYIAELRSADPSLRFALATNQGGVAHGFHDAGRMTYEIGRVARALGEDVLPVIAFGMPDGNVAGYTYVDPLRKPAPGALLLAMKHFDVTPRQTLMVGDRHSDAMAAEAAGCRFELARDFFLQVEPPQRGLG